MLLDRTLDQRYKIIEQVGGGGMAEVYRGHDLLLDRPVAIKILRSHFLENGQNEAFIKRFRREAQAAAKLSHPNIVNIYDVGEDDDIYYIIMEFISGETLKEKLENSGMLPIEEALKVALEIAEGLEHAHQNQLVHCDVKPHNIMVTKTGRIKVTDFGIARAVSSATLANTGTIMGSVHYFSPEQAKGLPVSAQSDIYSLGVVLYELLTGHVPFEGDSPIAIALKHIQEAPVPPRRNNPSIPPLVESIVLKALEKDPQNRYQSISDMIHDLKVSQGYLRDDNTRRLSYEDYATQVLPRISSDVEPREKALDAITEKPEGVLAAMKRSKGLIAFFTLLLLIGFGIGAFMAFGKFWSNKEVTVPNVVGKSVDSAKSILTEQHLRVSITEVFNDKVPSGQVIQQTPEAGSVVKEDRTITLIVSKGSEIILVPDLRGLSRKDAEIKLKNLGLQIGNIQEQYSQDQAPDTVISQNPRPPAQIGKGSTVDLVISKGPTPKKFNLPDFTGSLLSTINTQLDGLKLKLGTVTEVPSSQAPGTILSQNPTAGTSVAEGTAVDFSVAKDAGSARRVNLQLTVPSGPDRQAVQIITNDSTGRHVVYEKLHRPGERVDKTVEVTGTASAQIYINGNLYKELSI